MSHEIVIWIDCSITTCRGPAGNRGGRVLAERRATFEELTPRRASRRPTAVGLRGDRPNGFRLSSSTPTPTTPPGRRRRDRWPDPQIHLRLRVRKGQAQQCSTQKISPDADRILGALHSAPAR